MDRSRTLRLTLVAAVGAAVAAATAAAGARAVEALFAGLLAGVATALVLARRRLQAARRTLAAEREVAAAAAERVRWLSALVRAFSAATRPEEVAEVAFDGCRALGATHANIGWLAADGRAVETLFAYGHPDMVERWQRYPLDAPMPNAAAIRTGAPQFLPDAASYDSAWPETAVERARVGVGAWVSWPLTLASAPRGVLGFGFPGPRELGRAERDAAATIAEHAAQALERARLLARAEALVAEREDLLRAVSHDFRTPLQAVLLRAESLARDGGDPARVARLSRAIAESARRMGAAVQDVVHVARLGEGEPAPRREVVPLAPFVAELTRRLFEDADLARLDVALAPDAAVRVDPAHLERIVVNLVDNALKYSEAPAPVRIRSEPDGEHRIVTVSDDGPGIPPEDLPLLFRRYSRGSRLSARQGTGLGLYVTRMLAEAQGGEVSVESPPGRGATFRVRLPAA